MRRVVSKKEPIDKNVLWAKPSSDGTYFIEQLWGPNGWELFGEGSDGSAPFVEKDPVAIARIQEIENKIPSSTSSLNQLVDENTLDTTLAGYQEKLTAGPNISIIGNVISSTSAVMSVNGKTGVVTITAADLGLTTALQLKGQKDTAATIQAMPDDLGAVYQAIDTGHLWASTSNGWIDLGATQVDLSNYYTKSEVDTKDTAVTNSAVSQSNTYTDTKTGLLQDQIDTLETNSASTTDLANKQNSTTVSMAGEVLLGGAVAGTFGSTGIDTSPVDGSNDLITSGGVAAAINDAFNGYIPALKDNAGQIKANYTGLSVSNFAAGTVKTIPLNTVTPTISASPTTVYPYNSPMDYSAMWDSANQKLRENNILGQVHKWRIQGTYANKATGNNGQLQFRLHNTDSGFIVTSESTLPTGLTTGNFTFELTTIADNDSLAAGKGYILEVVTSFADNNLIVNISSIMRVSQATELTAAISSLARTYSIVMPEEVFDYNGTNTYTLSQTPVVISTVMIDHGDSFTLVTTDNITVDGKNVTIKNETITTGDRIRISYSI